MAVLAWYASTSPMRKREKGKTDWNGTSAEILKSVH